MIIKLKKEKKIVIDKHKINKERNVSNSLLKYTPSMKRHLSLHVPNKEKRRRSNIY